MGTPNKTIRAIYEKGVFRPVESVDLPDNTEVRLRVESEPSPKGRSTLAAIADLAEEFPDNPDLPEDLAAQHDHYLYGTPKR